METTKENIINFLEESYRSFTNGDLLKEIRAEFEIINEQISKIESYMNVITIFTLILSISIIILTININKKINNNKKNLLKLKEKLTKPKP